MNDHVVTLAEAARQAASNIIRLTAHVMSESAEPERTGVFEGVQETILALIAAILTADGVTTSHEDAFTKLLARDLEEPERRRAFLEEYSNRWVEIAQKTPGFFSTVLEYDLTHKTTISRDLIRELRNVAYFAATVDGDLALSETRAAAAFIDRIDELFRQARWSVTWDDDSLPAIPLAASLSRKEFRNREIV